MSVAVQPTSALRSRYDEIADRLSDEARHNAEVSVYLSADDVARALGDDKYDPDKSPFDTLRDWIIDRRRLGFTVSGDDVLDWIQAEAVA